MTYRLIGTEVSLFTGKARGYLRWSGLPFEEVGSTREVYRDVILPRVGWPVIPVLITPDDHTVQDTSDIIAHVDRLGIAPSVYPTGPKQRLAALLMELFGDEWLVIPAMHYRWNYNEDWIYGEFGAMSAPEETPERQYEIGKANGQKFKGFVPTLGVSDSTIPAIEARYEAFLVDFARHLDLHPFLLGSRPSIGDYGLLGPLYAHLYRDPKSGELMKRIAPKVADWVERTHWPKTPGSGEFLPDDEVPVTLEPIFRQQFEDQLPLLETTANALNTWAETATPGDFVPRALGMSAFKIADATGQRALMSFNLWRLQPVLDHLHALQGDDRSRAEAWLHTVGGEALTRFPIFPRLTRRDFKLALAR